MSAERVNGIARYAKMHGWNLMIQDRLGHTPLAWNGDGVIATIRSDTESSRVIQMLRNRGIPVVDLTISRPDIRLPRVMSDHAELGRLAARHFVEREFRHVAWFSTGWGNVHRLRFEGFSEISPEKPTRWVVSDDLPLKSQNNWPDFVRWLRDRLASVTPPVAVLTYDETDAARLLYAAKELGCSVPEEVAILSIGNNPLICENQSVPLSSIDQNLEQGGFEAAALLDRMMAHELPTTSSDAPVILIPPRGVVTRQSTNVIAVSDPMLLRALVFIRENLARPIGAPEIAAALGIPRIRLDRLFRTQLYRAVGEEIRRQRLARARLLLETTNHSIKEIASETGFCSPSHLSNVFRDATGQSPRAWRPKSPA